jgi:streptomycin 6-kinase
VRDDGLCVQSLCNCPENRVIEVSPLVRNKALAAGAADWLERLPVLVGELAAEWGFQLGRTFGDGTEAFVAAVERDDGSAAVLKLIVPRSAGPGADGPGAGSAAEHEIKVLELAGGDGCAQRFRSDATRGALLMERLGPSLHDLGLPLARRQEILCATASRLWRAAPDAGLPTGADKGRWLVDFVTRTWEALDRPCSERAVEHALDCARRRIAAHDDERAVLVHGDVHEWNALAAGAGFKLVDPDGLLAEAEYDLGIMMREDPVELLEVEPMQRAQWLAARTGLDATAIWEWGVVERVSTGLVCTQIDLQPVGRQMLRAADRIAEAARRRIG